MHVNYSDYNKEKKNAQTNIKILSFDPLSLSEENIAQRTRRNSKQLFLSIK